VEAIPVVEETTNDGQAEKALGDEELMEELDFSSIDAFFNNQLLVDHDLTGAGSSTTLSTEPPTPVPLGTSRTELQYVSYSDFYSEGMLMKRRLPQGSRFQPLYISPLADTHFIVVRGMSTSAALFTNAKILQIRCDYVRAPDVYVEAGFKAPAALIPVPLQTQNPHYPYIDLLPFPKLRHNLLHAGNMMNPREMWEDLTDGDVKVWGNSPWDEKGWEFGEKFISKYWYVMDNEVLSTANFWRMTRDEPMLSLEAIKSRLGIGEVSDAFSGHQLIEIL
jgi:hypothetical protein